MDIFVYILLKNKRFKVVSVNPEKPYFVYNNIVYVLDSESIGLRSKAGILSPKPMCLYFEGIPTAVRMETKDLKESAKLLNTFVEESNVKGASTAPSGGFGFLLEYLKHPEKILMLFVFSGLGIYIFYYLINMILSGGLHF